jgi:hypothetical protein
LGRPWGGVVEISRRLVPERGDRYEDSRGQETCGGRQRHPERRRRPPPDMNLTVDFSGQKPALFLAAHSFLFPAKAGSRCAGGIVEMPAWPICPQTEHQGRVRSPRGRPCAHRRYYPFRSLRYEFPRNMVPVIMLCINFGPCTEINHTSLEDQSCFHLAVLAAIARGSSSSC